MDPAREKRAVNPRVYLDIAIGSKVGGRVELELFADVTPRTAENFRSLCTGERGNNGMNGPNLHYLGSRFFKVISKTMIQGGDIVNDDGTGDPVSIYGSSFRDESFIRRHAHGGSLGMLNNGRHSNGCQFYITTRRCSQYDGKFVVFGHVISGMDVVRAIENVPVNSAQEPRVAVRITGCGELAGGRSRAPDEFESTRMYIRQLMSQDEKISLEQLEGNKKSLPYSGRKPLENLPPKGLINLASNVVNNEDAIVDDGISSDHVEDADAQDKYFASLPQVDPSRILDPRQKKLLELKLKMQRGRRNNKSEVIEEKKRQKDPAYEIKVSKKIAKSAVKDVPLPISEQAERKDDGNDNDDCDDEEDEGENKGYYVGRKWKKKQSGNHLNESAAIAQYRDDTKAKKKDGNFGWNVFNVDTLYKAHKKRTANLTLNQVEYEKQKAELGEEEFYDAPIGMGMKPTEEGKERAARDIQDQKKKRKAFSRRRAVNEEEDISYISERNRIFNKKLERSFGAYSLEIKQNLERGTALN